MSAETQAHQLPEASSVNIRRVLWAAGGALMLLAGAIAALDAVYRREVPVRTVPPPQAFPEPQLRVDEHTQLQQILAVQRRRLDTNRWADDQHQTAQIPIARAMQIIAQEGAQAYAPLIASTPASSSPTAGAERAVTPGDTGGPGPTTTGTTTTEGGAAKGTGNATTQATPTEGIGSTTSKGTAAKETGRQAPPDRPPQNAPQKKQR